MHPKEKRWPPYVRQIKYFIWLNKMHPRATYKRAMTVLFKKMLGDMVEHYFDDLVVKSHQRKDHISRSYSTDYADKNKKWTH